MQSINENNQFTKNVIFISVPVNVNFASALITGLVISACFHPIDRALYLKNIDRGSTHLFAPKYWKNPFSGLRNTVYQRMLSNSVYFTAQGELNFRLKPWMLDNQYGPLFTQMTIGLLAGMATGFFSNASYAVKYYSFKHGSKKRPLENAAKMWKQGGIYPFFKGIFPGIIRDSIFGISYEMLNYMTDSYILDGMNRSEENSRLKQSTFLVSRFFSATVATTLSSPFNYARNIQFSTLPQNKQPLMMDILSDVWRESNRQVKECPERAFFTRMKFLQSRFMIGAGTCRAGAGMAIGQNLMNTLKPAIQDLDSKTENRNNFLK